MRTLPAIAALCAIASLGVVVPGVVVPAAAADACTTPMKVTTTKGEVVWQPSSRSAGPFQWGGSQSLSKADGSMTATTKGHTDTVGGTAGVSFKIFAAQAKYDHQWNRSTTTTQSFTSTFTTNSGNVSRKTHWRWRLYVKAYLFTSTESVYHPAPCANREEWSVTAKVVVPAQHPDYSFGIETYAHKDWLKHENGTSFRL